MEVRLKIKKGMKASNKTMGRGFIIVLRLRILLCLLSSIIFSPSTIAFADSDREGRLHFGADIGSAMMDIKRNNIKDSDTWLYGAIIVEYMLYHQLLIGIEGSGWTNQKDVNSAITEDVTTLMLTSRLYPSSYSSAFIKAGWGYAEHSYWETSKPGKATGVSYLIGMGYDIYASSLSISYSSCSLNNETYKAMILSLGYTFK